MDDPRSEGERALSEFRDSLMTEFAHILERIHALSTEIEKAGMKVPKPDEARVRQFRDRLAERISRADDFRK